MRKHFFLEISLCVIAAGTALEFHFQHLASALFDFCIFIALCVQPIYTYLEVIAGPEQKKLEVNGEAESVKKAIALAGETAFSNKNAVKSTQELVVAAYARQLRMQGTPAGTKFEAYDGAGVIVRPPVVE